MGKSINKPMIKPTKAFHMLGMIYISMRIYHKQLWFSRTGKSVVHRFEINNYGDIIYQLSQDVGRDL